MGKRLRGYRRTIPYSIQDLQCLRRPGRRGCTRRGGRRSLGFGFGTRIHEGDEEREARSPGRERPASRSLLVLRACFRSRLAFWGLYNSSYRFAFPRERQRAREFFAYLRRFVFQRASRYALCADRRSLTPSPIMSNAAAANPTIEICGAAEPVVGRVPGMLWLVVQLL